MRIGIDIDDVIYPFSDRFLDYSDRAGSLMQSWTFWQAWGWDQERFTKEHDTFICQNWYVNGAIVGADTPEYINKLRAAGHEIVFITARKGSTPDVCDYIQSDTKYWLSTNNIEYDELHFASDKTQFNVDYMVDDNVGHYSALEEAGVDVYLMTKSWNVDAPDCQRVNTFAEYAQIILNKDKKVSDEVRITSSTGGQKGEKSARFDLIPADAMIEVAKHYGFGAKKYSDNNWRLGYPWHLVVGALERHLNEFKAGRDYDLHNDDCPEDCLEHTESHHMAAVVFHALAILTFKDEHPEFDDRFKK